jgi:hypothetical protein
VLIILVELVLDARGDIVEAALSVAASGRNCLYVAPKPMPRFSVMRFDTSTEKSVSRVAGASPLAGVLIIEIVGSDNSSATKGSSVASVSRERIALRQYMRESSIGGGDAGECGDDPV